MNIELITGLALTIYCWNVLESCDQKTKEQIVLAIIGYFVGLTILILGCFKLVGCIKLVGGSNG